MIDQFPPEARKQALQYLTTVMDTDRAALADGVSEKESHQVNCCPHCKATAIHKYGMAKKTGSQRYRCKDCGKTLVLTMYTRKTLGLMSSVSMPYTATSKHFSESSME